MSIKPALSAFWKCGLGPLNSSSKRRICGSMSCLTQFANFGIVHLLKMQRVHIFQSESGVKYPRFVSYFKNWSLIWNQKWNNQSEQVVLNQPFLRIQNVPPWWICILNYYNGCIWDESNDEFIDFLLLFVDFAFREFLRTTLPCESLEKPSLFSLTMLSATANKMSINTPMNSALLSVK